MNVAYVQQPNGYGCAIACCAMIVGKNYFQMEQWFLDNGLARERMEKGLWSGIYFEALWRHGFVRHERFRHDPIMNAPSAAPWPPAPFAPIHFCTADVPGGHHAFVMLGDGRVLDPFKPERTSIAHPDYIDIACVMGLWRVGA